MNIFNRVTLATLRKNKMRTVVTIIGIMLSAAMICAVTTFISSIQNYGLQNMLYTEGSWHGNAQNLNVEQMKELASDSAVKQTVYSQRIGYAEGGNENENKPYLYVIGAGKDFESMMPVHLTAGRYPTSTSEILLPEHLMTIGGYTARVGDVLTLDLGLRMLDGCAVWQDEPNYTYDDDGLEVLKPETLEVLETRVYTVVGFYERPSFEGYTAPGYTLLTLADETPDAEAIYDVYFTMRKTSDVYAFMEDHGYGGKVNNDVLMFSGVSRYNGFYGYVFGLAAIVMTLILFGSVSLIYNAFSISVSERTKQFGLLSSVGATKKQLRHTVFFEAFAVSVVGIPLGILVGIGGIGVTLLLIGNKFTVLFGSSFPIPMRVCVSAASVIAACIVAGVTVLISAWIPSKRAMKVSAVEAIRQNGDIRAENRPSKTSRLTYRLFGLPGVLASKHYRRNRKKYRSTIMSLFMSIVLFVSAAAFTGYLTESFEGGFFGLDYDLSLEIPDEAVGSVGADVLLERMRNEAKIREGTYMRTAGYQCEVERKYLSDQLLKIIRDTPENPIDLYVTPMQMWFVNDADFRALLQKYHLNEQDYMNPDQPLAIAVDGRTDFDPDAGKFVTVYALKGDNTEITCSTWKKIDGYRFIGSEGDKEGDIIYRYQNIQDENDILRLPESEATEQHTLRAGKTITERPYFVDQNGLVNFIYPYSVADTVLPEKQENWNTLNFIFTADDHAAAYGKLKEMMSGYGFSGYYLNDYAELQENNRNLVTIIQVFAFGFIVLISLIAAANVFNTISTNISLRRREFAMLKSVGMARGGFNRMMCYECLLYGSRALLWGLPVSVGMTYLIYLATNQGFATTFRLPWAAIGIAVLSVFAVVFVTMMYAMRKIKKDNPIDALKNENL